jgi:hypothetical protein
MLRHLFVLGRDVAVPPEGLTITLDRHLARGEQIEIIRDRRRPPGEAPNPQSLSGRERRRASQLAEQLRTNGFAIFSRQEEPARRIAPPPPPPEPPPPAAPAPPSPPVGARRAPAPAPSMASDVGSPYDEMPSERDTRRASRFELRREPRPASRPFARPQPPDDDDDALNDRDGGRLRRDMRGYQDLHDEDEWPDPRSRSDSRRGRVVALVVLLLLAAGAGIFYLGQQVELRRLTPSLSTTATERAPSAPAPAPESASPVVPAPAAPPAAQPEPAPPRSAAVPAAPAPVPSAPARAPTAPPRAPTAPAPPVSTPPAATASESRRAPEPAPEAAERESAPRELPPRPSLPPRRAVEQPEPSLPAATRGRTLPIFPGLPRVEVSRATGAEGTTFTVRLADPAGRPLRDAHVSLRQTMGDGSVRETPLEPVSPPGSYRGAVPGAVRRGDALALRVDLGDRRVEMPVTD